MFKPNRDRRSASTTILPTINSGIFSFEILIFSLNWIMSRTLDVSRRVASRNAISFSGNTTSAPSFVSISPCSSPFAFAITFGIPMETRFSVVKIEVSRCSPIQTIAMSQFCSPTSCKVFFSRFWTTYAFSVYSLISRTFSSS